MTFRTCTFIWLLLLACVASAQNPITVLPWNGHTAALSLTFDDGLPVHIETAIPAMAKRGLRGTFYLPSTALKSQDWHVATAYGQEVGNHSVHHWHPAALEAPQISTEVGEADYAIYRAVGVAPFTFAYPYGEITDVLKERVSQTYLAARTSDGDGFQPYMKPDSFPDWYSIPCQVAKTKLSFAVYKAWVDVTLEDGAWSVLQIHGIGAKSTGWQPMPEPTFYALLDYAQTKQSTGGLWVAGFGDVAAYWRAQKIFEGSVALRQELHWELRWLVPPQFPSGITLLVTAPPYTVLSQRGKKLEPTGEVYKISFDAGELIVSDDE